MIKELEIILSHLDHNVVPIEPFICVLGTSHTYGDCVRGNSMELEYSNIWSSILSKKIGIKVLNLGLPGSSNDDLAIALRVFLHIENFRKYCVGIIVEGRFGKDSFLVDVPAMLNYGMQKSDESRKELFKKFVKNARQKQSQYPSFSEIFNMKDVKKGLGDLWGDEFLSKYAKNNPLSYRFAMTELESDINSQIDNIISSTEHKLIDYFDDQFEFSPLEIYRMFEYINICVLSHRNSIQSVISICARPLEIIKEISKNMNVPFYWFSMDNYTNGTNPYTIQTFEEENDVKMFKYGESFMTNLYDFQMLEFGAAYVYLMENKELAERCDCGHYTEPFHNWIADKVYNEIKGEIHK